MVDNSKVQKEEKDKAAKADGPKAGADVGKIVNLMAGDCNRVWNIICFFSSFLLMPHFRYLEQHLRSIFFMEVRVYISFFPNSLTSYPLFSLQLLSKS